VHPPGGERCWSSGGGGRIVCMRDLVVLNEVWAQGNIYFGRHFDWLKYFTYHLISVLAPNHKQHILSPAEVTKVCYSLAELHARSVYLNLFWSRRTWSSWYILRGAPRYINLVTSVFVTEGRGGARDHPAGLVFRVLAWNSRALVFYAGLGHSQYKEVLVYWQPVTWKWEQIKFPKCHVYQIYLRQWTMSKTVFSLLSKNESRLIKSPACLCVCVCPPLITFFNQSVDFHEI
jgi:hypothetical protein